jgi:hypothetical protein
VTARGGAARRLGSAAALFAFSFTPRTRLRLPSRPGGPYVKGALAVRFSQHHSAVKADPQCMDLDCMDRNTIFGGNPFGVLLRLALISIVVGIVMKALGIDLSNFFQRINELLRNIYDLGFGAIEWVLEYMLLGALVVVPIWLIARLAGASRSKSE